MTERLSPRTGAALLAAAAALLLAWSIAVPIFEAPDEPAHWQYARYLHDEWTRGHWSLPRYVPGFEEANSPPLYYAAIAPVAAPAAGPPIVLTSGEHGTTVSLAPPRSFYDADRDLGRYVPIRLARLASIAMALVTIWLSYLTGRTATGRTDTGLLTALLIALLPQFTFRAMNVSNDALMTTCSAAVTLGLVRQIRDGFTWSRGLWTAAALAGAYLSKISAIALAVPFAFVLLTSPGAVRQRLSRFSVFGLALLIVLPWSLRNIALYGDPFASGAMREVVAHIITERSLFSRYFLGHFPVLLSLSFVGIFGWANVVMPLWTYLVYGAGALAACAGLTRGWIIGTLNRRLALTLALSALAALAIVVHINLSFTQPQGRYLFPALPALALLAALGLQSLPAALADRLRPGVVGAALAAGNLFALGIVVWPAYHPAIAREIAPGVRTLGIAATGDFAYAPPSDFVVTGSNPWWIVPLDEPAERYSEVEIAVRARLEPAVRKGCLSFATPTRELHQNDAACFTWIADGTSQRVRVSMRGRPGWTGPITHLRVDVLDDESPAPQGSRVTFEEWLIKGDR